MPWGDDYSLLCVLDVNAFQHICGIFALVCGSLQSHKNLLQLDHLDCVSLFLEEVSDPSFENRVGSVFVLVDFLKHPLQLVLLIQIRQHFYPPMELSDRELEYVHQSENRLGALLDLIKRYPACGDVHVIHDIIECRSELMYVLPVEWSDKRRIEFRKNLVCQTVAM